MSPSLMSLKPEADIGRCTMQQEDRTARTLDFISAYMHVSICEVCTHFNIRLQKKKSDQTNLTLIY